MADYKVTDTQLVAIADAIRTKGGTSAQLEFPAGFVSAINNIPTGGGGGVTIVPFSSGTDEEIAAMIDAAQQGTIDLQQDGGWSLGDVRTIHIDAFNGGGDIAVSYAAQDIDIVISSFNEYMSCGNVMQFDFKDSLTPKQKMNLTSTNVGGYGQSEIKTTTIPALVNALPTWLKDRLIEFSVLTSIGDNKSTIETVTGNKLALRSEVELFGSTTYSKVGEGTQVEYYTTSGSTIKKLGHGGSNDGYWERSPYNNNSMWFCYVASDGTAFRGPASNEYGGIAPFGCV